MQGNHYVGTLCDVSYEDLMHVFGEPNPMAFDSCKSDAGWLTTSLHGYEINIYNWKDGPNYCGPQGTPVDRITRWNIAGLAGDDVLLVERVIAEYKRGCHEISVGRLVARRHQPTRGDSNEIHTEDHQG